MIGPQEMIFIFLVILLLFGASKLPELAKSMGKSMGEFKRAQHETELQVQKLGAPVQEIKSIPQSIQKLAEELGIRTEGKDESKLLEEIKAGLKVRVDKG
ncbi:Sec-independent protein translocase protein TatAt [uncultured archaeon]|nr:Sec-independent protein translocase protein TatAt [uncultured archaeon]